MAIPFRISCQTPMLCAFAATGLLYWVVNFQESTRISRILFIRARRGARGKDATKRVMNPNWMTAREKRKVPKSAPTEGPSGWQWDNETCKLLLADKWQTSARLHKSSPALAWAKWQPAPAPRLLSSLRLPLTRTQGNRALGSCQTMLPAVLDTNSLMVLQFPHEWSITIGEGECTRTSNFWITREE